MKEKKRYLFFDLLRGWSLIIMMEAHVFNALMRDELRNTAWFSVMNYINGLVAPAFLFVSGAVFYLSTHGKTDELRSFGPSFRKKLFRILLVALAGYSLHLPFLSLNSMINEASRMQVMNFFAVDILQCIAAGLLLILFLKILIRNEESYLYITAIVLILVILVSPTVWKLELTDYLPLYIADYFSPRYGSLFPLLPWLSFLLAGVVFAYYFVRFRSRKNEAKFIKMVFIAGIIGAGTGHLLISGHFLPQSLQALSPDPVFILQRIAYVLVFIGLCWYYYYKRGEVKSYIAIVGMESLIVYWLHLQVIFRQFNGGTSIASIIDKSFNGVESALAFIILSMLMIIAAVLWNKFKARFPGAARQVTGIIVWGCLLIFFLL